jgi:hypothetical protein
MYRHQLHNSQKFVTKVCHRFIINQSDQIVTIDLDFNQPIGSAQTINTQMHKFFNKFICLFYIGANFQELCSEYYNMLIIIQFNVILKIVKIIKARGKQFQNWSMMNRGWRLKISENNNHRIDGNICRSLHDIYRSLWLWWIRVCETTFHKKIIIKSLCVRNLTD